VVEGITRRITSICGRIDISYQNGPYDVLVSGGGGCKISSTSSNTTWVVIVIGPLVALESNIAVICVLLTVKEAALTPLNYTSSCFQKINSVITTDAPEKNMQYLGK
jgi:hypothetical protein